MPEEEQPKKQIRVRHEPSPQFSTHHATGVVLSGTTPDGSMHLIFYADSIRITSETGDLVESGQNTNKYTLSLQTGDIANFREDKAVISMSLPNMLSLYELLRERYGTPDDPNKSSSVATTIVKG